MSASAAMGVCFAVVLVLAGVAMVVRSRGGAQASAEPEVDDDTEEMEEELTEADSLIAGEQGEAVMIEAALEVGRSRSLEPWEALRRRLRGAPGHWVAALLGGEAVARLRRRAEEETEPERAMALVEAVVLLEPARADLHAWGAERAMVGLDGARALRFARRAAHLDPSFWAVEARAELLFGPPTLLDLEVGEGPGAPVVRDVDALRAVLAQYSARIVARRRRLVAAGAPPDAPWWVPVPASWRGEGGPEPLDADVLDALWRSRCEWSAAHLLCHAVGWQDGEVEAAIAPMENLGAVRAEVERCLAGLLGEGDAPWRGWSARELPPSLAALGVEELRTIGTALAWLTDPERRSPFAAAPADIGR